MALTFCIVDFVVRRNGRVHGTQRVAVEGRGNPRLQHEVISGVTRFGEQVLPQLMEECVLVQHALDVIAVEEGIERRNPGFEVAGQGQQLTYRR